MTPPPAADCDVWKVLIGELLLIKNKINEHDREQIEDYTTPHTRFRAGPGGP
ncbi:hypothetical protein R8Z50_22510 [Longispora sp. K20-0274]|uniref:hypothetical protein n=1 Tax=Longispora sp. K20-0274 TaxID=3088255 RepID=UPI00399A8959